MSEQTKDRTKDEIAAVKAQWKPFVPSYKEISKDSLLEISQSIAISNKQAKSIKEDIQHLEGEIQKCEAALEELYSRPQDESNTNKIAAERTTAERKLDCLKKQIEQTNHFDTCRTAALRIQAAEQLQSYLKGVIGRPEGPESRAAWLGDDWKTQLYAAADCRFAVLEAAPSLAPAARTKPLPVADDAEAYHQLGVDDRKRQQAAVQAYMRDADATAFLHEQAVKR